LQWRIGQVQTLFRVCIHFMFRPIAFGSAMGKPSQGNQGKCKQGKSQVVLLHISQVRRCVRKMRKMQVDVSSLFFVKNIVRFASVFLCIRCRVEVRGGAPRSFASYLGTCDKLCWICSGSGMGAPASSSVTPSSSSPGLTSAPTTPANSPLARLPLPPSALSDFSQPGPASPQSSFAWSLTSGRLSCCIFLPLVEKCLVCVQGCRS